MERPTIAAALIVKNEEDNLPRVINSLKEVVDKIYITDTGSTDKTVEIAASMGCEVSHFTWINDFAAARNYCFSQVKEDFTFWVDADDILDGKEAFIKFRDTAMGLADYWLANYNYAQDEKGNSVCNFMRERVVRTAKNFSWRYAVHEGITPDSGIQPVRMQFIPTWSIKHLRSAADVAKDRSRNLLILEAMPNKDARMEYYYGKELFENQQHFDAATVLSKVICSKELEHHDRILALQYCCLSLMACNQYEKALAIATEGLVIAPHRAEFYCTIGDCYLKLGKMQDALPSFYAAMGCLNAPINAPGAIYSNVDSYYVYPANQIARIKANMGLLDEAVRFCRATDDKHPNDESKGIIEEIKKVQARETGYKNAVICDDIVITCPPQGPYEWDGDLYKTKAMGGSETAAIEMAVWLKRISGRSVKIFNNRTEAKRCDGVDYIPATEVTQYMSKFKPYIHIAWRHNVKLTDAPTFVWSHDLQTPGVDQLKNYDKVMCLTPFHKNYMVSTQGVPEDKIYVTRNGIDPMRFIEPGIKDPNKVIFPSSPDRGLDRAMRIMDKVRLKHPEAYLAVYYGIEHLPKYGRTDLMNELKAMMDERPWVKYYGATQQDELMKHFKEAAIWLYASDWIETSCVSAMEVICSGVYPIVRKIGGVADTLAYAESQGMAKLLPIECVTESEHQIFADEVCKAIEEKAWEKVSIDPYTISWEKVAKEWLDVLPTLSGK
jgi:glycosyltransferase involved in cell wall biosynthesis